MPRSSTSTSPRKRPPPPKNKRTPDLDDATRMAKALSHPLRARLLNRINEQVASPVELARELGEPLGNVSYHVQVLLELDCIELASTTPRRGAVEHHYRATRRVVLEDTAWERLSRRARREIAGEWFNKSFTDLAAAMETGGFERVPDVHMSFTRLVLDEKAWSELAKTLRDVYERALELEAECAKRLQGDGKGGEQVDARLVMAQYEAARRGPKSRAKPKSRAGRAGPRPK